MDNKPLSTLGEVLIASFEEEDKPKEGNVSVNPLIAKVASWYEKLRNAMDYREEEVILRAAIERIIKRRLLLGGTGQTIAEPLIKELVWARYFEDNIISESVIEKVAQKIDHFLHLRLKILGQLEEKTINEWTYQLMSCDIVYLLDRDRDKEVLSNFMFQVVSKNIQIIDDTEQNKDIQTFISVRRSFARDDIAFLRYHLFSQIFGTITKNNIETIASKFNSAYEEIQKQLSYPIKEKIYNFILSKTGIFFILEDLMRIHRGNMKELLKDQEAFKKEVLQACELRYNGISKKVRRAIIRSFVFILITKAFFALFIEGTAERFFYDRVSWNAIVFNITIPPALMIFAGAMIRSPKKENSLRILSNLEKIFFDEDPKFAKPLVVKVNPDKQQPMLDMIFRGLWFLAYILTFGGIMFALTKLGFSLFSIGVFLFFMAIVSFLSYRIWLTSRVYTIEEKPGVFAPIADFLFMPIIRVGRELTQGFSQINVFLFLFDFIIETPFKGIFGFFEQWFLYLQSKREDIS